MEKIAVIGTVGIPACYGGFESLVENLTKNSSNKIEYTVFCSAKDYNSKLEFYNNAKLIYLPFRANGIQSVLYDIFSLLKCLYIKPNVVLILGVSGCVFLPVFKIFSRSKIVTNIDGFEWKRDKWGKWIRRFLKWSESLAVKYSDVVITDNQAISDYVLKEYAVKSQTIAYGGDHAIRNLNISPSKEEFDLGLCRIEPENNVVMILEAFSKSKRKLKFVGNWQASEFGRMLKRFYSVYDNIELLDPIYDLDSLYQLRMQCSRYIHGHSAGGTNPSLVEMMHFGIPIFTFDCSFNRYSTDNKAHYFKNSDELSALLNTVMENDLKKNAIAMKNIATKRYTWGRITENYESLYINDL
ncbi:DUF1972 domain-containing protein [Vibrio mimicus]|uniref:DUF1972 domain-containing protein n=1 Tax=Vibrio mimicus TaxID=674 RepID=UPI0001BACE18|nr:DUF1972 domain-containing protein [Vibrio mimicus]EEY46453.1 alpha-D-GlcNAc alpha-1,2-L-rhamnosyltransferase [Vibrio mimicus VM223]